MEREQMIKKIVDILYKADEWHEYDEKYEEVANEIINTIVPEGTVVLTAEEYAELKQRPEKVHNETARKIFFAIDKYSDKCFETVDAGIDRESYDSFDYCKFFRWLEKYAKKFGVEVEE